MAVTVNGTAGGAAPLPNWTTIWFGSPPESVLMPSHSASIPAVSQLPT
jgi:hypothetical protein